MPGLRAFVAAALGSAAFAASAAAAVPVRFERIAGFAAPGTPARYDRVGILKTGLRSARNILVLNPGTSASAAYFEPLAKDIVRRLPGWQVWSVERRENLLEDQSMFDRAKQGKATNRQVFDYYLGWLADSSISNHLHLIPDSAVAFARDWGMNVEVNDLRRVVLQAERLGGHVVVGGHSLGGTITTAYATWDFNGRPGADGLSGLVYDDGASNPTPITRAAATLRLVQVRTGTPWLAFGGFPAPYAGLLIAVAADAVILDPNGLSFGQGFPLLPAALKPPGPATNAAQFGFALDVKTSTANLRAAQAHLGRLDTRFSPLRWNGAGALTPLRRYATMFSGWGLSGLDGAAWYHPLRLTVDGGAVANGNANPAQDILGVHATEGHRLPRRLRIYAFGAVGGAGVPASALALARQSHIPLKNLSLFNFAATYAHNDPAGASPASNAFLRHLLPFLRGVGRTAP